MNKFSILINTTGLVKEDLYIWAFVRIVSPTYEVTDEIIHAVTGKLTVKTQCCRDESFGVPECDYYFAMLNQIPYLPTSPVAIIQIDIDKGYSNIKYDGEYYIYETV